MTENPQNLSPALRWPKAVAAAGVILGVVSLFAFFEFRKDPVFSGFRTMVLLSLWLLPLIGGMVLLDRQNETSNRRKRAVWYLFGTLGGGFLFLLEFFERGSGSSWISEELIFILFGAGLPVVLLVFAVAGWVRA